MKTYMHFCMHLEHNSLNIYQREHFFPNKWCRKSETHIYTHTTFCMPYMVFDIPEVKKLVILKSGSKNRTHQNRYAMRTFRNLLLSLS
jgi:hypothetical protein